MTKGNRVEVDDRIAPDADGPSDAERGEGLAIEVRELREEVALLRACLARVERRAGRGLPHPSDLGGPTIRGRGWG